MGGSLPVVSHPSDPAFLVLHALRLKGFAEAGAEDPIAYALDAPGRA